MGRGGLAAGGALGPALRGWARGLGSGGRWQDLGMKEEVEGGPRMSHKGQPSTPDTEGTRFSGEGSDGSEEGLVGRCEQGGRRPGRKLLLSSILPNFSARPPRGGSSQSQRTAFSTVFEKPDQTWASTSIKEPLPGSPLRRLGGRPLPPPPGLHSVL